MSMKILLIILNKNNASGLKKCLESITKMDGFCTLFHVLIMDGGSRDASRKVAETFEKKYGCIFFKVQKILGGTGYARIEGCEYAFENGYDIVIWGDSENIYERAYVKSIIKKIKDEDVVGGVPIVHGGFYAHAFAWYHAVHMVFPGLHRYHIPGNNRAERVNICRKFMYPASMRSEDYGLSMLLRKMNIRMRQDVATDARVHVSLPENFRDIISWQNSRAKGAAQALRKINAKPSDAAAWSLSLIILLFFIALFPFIITPLIIYISIYFIFSLWIFARSKKFLESPKNRYFFAPFFGLIIYSYYSLKTIFYYIQCGN